jgi:hypothetical protein
VPFNAALAPFITSTFLYSTAGMQTMVLIILPRQHCPISRVESANHLLCYRFKAILCLEKKNASNSLAPYQDIYYQRLPSRPN